MLSQTYWLTLSHDTRRKIAILLDIPRSGGTEVSDNRVISDGHTQLDLSIVTLDYLQNFMQSKEEDFYKLFKQLVERVEAPAEPIGEVPAETPEAPSEEEIPTPKRKKKPSKKSK